MSKTFAVAGGAPSLRKYLGTSCALCGSTVHGKGYFCSFRCDAKEYEQRAAVSKAAYDSGRPIKRKESVR